MNTAKHKFSLFAFFILLTAYCIPLTAHAQKDYTKYVNPFIGTGGHGHTFPGATVPFGFVQLSLDTRVDNWDGSSGYHYSDSIIYGFSHTHLSGTRIPNYVPVRVIRRLFLRMRFLLNNFSHELYEFTQIKN